MWPDWSFKARYLPALLFYKRQQFQEEAMGPGSGFGVSEVGGVQRKGACWGRLVGSMLVSVNVRLKEKASFVYKTNYIGCSMDTM